MSDKLELRVVFAAVDKFSSAARAIRGAAQSTSKELKEAKEALKGLENNQKLIDSFRSTNKNLGITQNDLKLARERVEQMAKAMQDIGLPSAKMQRDFKAATEDARNLSATVNRLAEKKQRLRGEMSAVGIDTKKLSEHQRDLKGKIEAATAAVTKQDEALKQVNETQRKVHQFKADLQSAREKAGGIAAKGAGAMAAGAAISAGAGYTVAKFADLQESTTLLKTSMMDASGNVDSSFDAIMKKANELGAALPGTTRDFVEAARALKQQGLGSPTIVNGGLQASAYLGVRFKMDQARSAEFIAKAKEAHGLKDSDLPAAADYMHRAKEAYGLKQDDIYESMKYAATDLNLKGQVGDMKKLKEYLAIQGAAGQAGLEGSTFGTNFSHMLKVMASVSGKLDGARGQEGKEVKELLDKFKIQFDFYGKDGKFLGFENMVRELQKLKPLKDQDQERVLKKLFDTEGSRVAGLLLKMGTDGYQQNLTKLDNIASLNKVIDEMSKTLTFQTEAFQGNLETLSASVGQHLEPMAAGSLENLNKVIEFAQKFNQEHPVFSGNLIKAVTILGTLLTVLGGIAIAMSVFTLIGPYVAALGIGANFAALLSGSLGILKGAIIGVGRALLMNPIGLIITGIAIAAFLIYKYWEPIKAFFSDLWSGVSTATKLAWNELQEWFSTLPDYFKRIGTAITDGLWGGLKNGFAWVKEKLGIQAKELPKPVEAALDVHSPSRVFERIGNFTMLGLEKGLAGGEDGPLSALAGTARKLAALGAGVALGAAPMAASAGSLTSGGDNYYITIQAPAGSDAPALAAEVERVLERIQSRKAAAQRSRLRDME